MTITGLNRGTGARALAALLALTLLLLGLTLASSAEPAAAKRSAKAGKGKRGNARGNRGAAAKPVVRTYVARPRPEDPGPFGPPEPNRAKAVLRILFNARHAPVKVTVLRLVNANASCYSSTPGSRQSETVPSTWKFPRPIAVTATRSEGVRSRGFRAALKGKETAKVTGDIPPGSRTLSLLVQREFTLPGSAVGSSEPEFECSVFERMSGNLVVAGKPKAAPRSRGKDGRSRSRGR